MEWSDDGFVISTRKHGEAAAIVSLLTREHGRHAGLVRGGAGRRQRGTLQIGNNVHATWRARLPEHLGNFTCELTGAHAAGLLDLKMPLLALGSAAALLETALPERAPHPESRDGKPSMAVGRSSCWPIWALVSISANARRRGTTTTSFMSRRGRRARYRPTPASPIATSCSPCRRFFSTANRRPMGRGSLNA
jgi:hypothetical protein